MYVGQTRLDDVQPSFQQIQYVFSKVKTYADSINIPVFINIGGESHSFEKTFLIFLKVHQNILEKKVLVWIQMEL